jgi:hypothetical protein
MILTGGLSSSSKAMQSELHASIGDLTVVNAILLMTLFYRLCSSKTAFPTVKSPNDTHNFSNTKTIFLKYRNST